MNSNLILLLVALIICLQLTLAKEKAKATIYSLEDVDQYWTSFKQKHQYFKKLNNEMERKVKFLKNLIKINEHNARYNNGSETYYLGITRFADWDSQEFASFVKSGGLNKKMIPKNVTNLETANFANANAAPSSIDWRDYKGQSYVQAIKDQGQCGSCWAFSAVSALESYAALSNNGSYLPNLSEQNLVDCVYDFDTCNYGGNVLEAWDYILMNGGIATESNYPYKSGSSETVS